MCTLRTSLAVLLFLPSAACHPSTTSSGDRASVNQVLRLPSGSGEIVNPPVDSSISLMDLRIEPLGQPTSTIMLQDGTTATVTFTFATERSNIAGGGLRLGETGPISYIPMRGVFGRPDGLIRYWFTAGPSFCEHFTESDTPCRDIPFQGYAVTERGAVSPPLTAPAVLFCGPCSHPSCQTFVESCQGQTAEVGASCNQDFFPGDDIPPGQPERITINLGSTSGVFLFRYDMMSRGTMGHDRMVLSYEGHILFDTGCVGTIDPLEEQINYSGSSQLAEVEVTSNCSEGGGPSEWSFFVSCATSGSDGG